MNLLNFLVKKGSKIKPVNNPPVVDDSSPEDDVTGTGSAVDYTNEPKPTPTTTTSNQNPDDRPDETTKRQEAVKAAFLHTWNGYVKYAWGYDELKPVRAVVLSCADVVGEQTRWWRLGWPGCYHCRLS